MLGWQVCTTVSIYAVLGMEPWASYMPGKYSTNGIAFPGPRMDFRQTPMLLFSLLLLAREEIS